MTEIEKKERFQKKISHLGIEVLSFSSARSPVKIKLNCSHVYETYPNSIYRNVKNNNGAFVCEICNNITRRLSPQQIKKEISDITDKEYSVKDISDYSSSRTSKIKVLHKTCGNIFEITYSNFKLGRRCPICASKSVDSKIAQNLKRTLDFLNIEYEEEKIFDNLKNPFTGKHLRFDIFLPKYKVLIEIDGKQHYKEVSKFGGSRYLKDIKYKDFLKNKFVKKTNLKLYRIPLYNIFLKKDIPYEESRKTIFNLLLKIVKEG
jgi:hypothetical protein